jgi:hypothetical protein
VFLALVAGCANGRALDYGSVRGLTAPCVGAALPGTTSVTVYARRKGHVVETERVLLTRSPGNPYELRLPAGQYVISAPRSGLPGRTVRVRPNETVRLNFIPACK